MPRKKIISRAGVNSSNRTSSASNPTRNTVVSKKITRKRPVSKKTTHKKRPTRVRQLDRVQPGIDIGPIWKDIGQLVPEELKLSARRPDDLLVFDLLVDNLKVAAGAPPRLVKRNPNKSAAIILRFPPQHFGEQAFLEKTGPEAKVETNQEPFQETSKEFNVDAIDKGDDPIESKNVETDSAHAEHVDPLPAANMRMAGPSRLVFSMPDDEAELGLGYEEILDACRRWPMRLSVLAAPERRYKRVDKEWLKELTSSQSWAAASELLSNAVASVASQAAVAAVKAAARRIAKQAAELAEGGNTRVTNARMKRSINTELESLQRRYSKLRTGAAANLVATALAAETTREFARKTPSFSANAVGRFPFLPILLTPHEPPESVTALELPYRLITSPISPSHWVHSSKAVINEDKRAELWHTRLSGTDTTGAPTPAKIRAIWSPDYGLEDIADKVNNTLPYRMSLDALDREMLVKLMAGYNAKRAEPLGAIYTPRPARSQRLMLSALGALLDVEGSWDPLPKMVGLEQWRHLASLGRDQYVRVVYKGFLFPFGHSASLIKVTERKFENHDGPKKRIAVLRQRFFIVVREPVRTYSGTGHQFEGRNFPFKSVRILTRVTPNLVAPDQAAATPINKVELFENNPELAKRTCFWPMVSNTTNFKFDVVVTDISGQNTSFSVPMLFVGVEANQSKASAARDAYNLEVAEPRRSAKPGGASISFAPLPTDPEAKGDPRLPTSSISFVAAHLSTPPNPNRPQVYPEVVEARVGIRAVQRMLNKPDATLRVNYSQIYKDNEFGGGNPGEVFLQAVEDYSLDFGEEVKSDSLGAIASPSMAIAGLSRIVGPAADLDQVAKNKFNPAQFFNNATILGGIKIADIIGLVSQLTLGDAPEMVSRELPDKIEASFDWQTKITSTDPAGLFVHSAGGETTLSISSLASTPFDKPSEATFESKATLNNFKINLFGFIIVWFDNLQFEAKAGSKPDVLVDLHPEGKAVEFGGPLEFVNELKDIIPMDGFSDPPNLTITPSGLTAGYSLNLPSIGVGIFTLANVSLGAGFSLPFDSRPMAVRFNFSERENPFSLTVSMFGGGGFFAIGVGTEGVTEIEAALEFGAGVAINLGVASGSVEVKAGVYFHWLQDSVELAGYVRLHGELSVLGLISASLTFNLQIAYLKEGKKSLVWGEASLIIEVEVLVFSASVEVHCRREFAGSESDPTFIDLIPEPALWATYCEAYALEEAA